MRKIEQLVVHCSANSANSKLRAEDIRRYHMEKKGWRDIGYHFVIPRDGELELGREIDEQGAGVLHFNEHSVHICLVGGLDKNGKPENNFTHKQFATLRQLLNNLQTLIWDRQGIWPAVVGHRDFPGVKKDCPCFDVIPWYYNMIPNFDEVEN
jgi:N-acetyl-anhydromuramyl-L-alanine amidase AmpD